MRHLTPPKMLTLLLTSLLLFGTGCAGGKRVVLVDPTDTILRTGPDLRGRVYFKNKAGEWELSRNKMQIPEGWYIGKL
jgi:hypothetical protein